MDMGCDLGHVIVSGKGRRWLASGHPWLFRDDLKSVDALPGALVRIEDVHGRTLGFGSYSRASRIAVRMISRGEAAPERSDFAASLARAIAWRARSGYLAEDGACRLLAGDAEGWPGLVVDRYARVIVLQSGTQGSERMRSLAVELLDELLPFDVECVVDRSDSAVRRLEELEKRVEIVRGELPSELVVREGDLVYEVDVLAGHKTGHYLDQRENRRRAGALAAGADVLDAFSYDGLFGVRAALGGARSVVCVDQSEAAGARVLANARRNRVEDRVTFVRANCMDDLRRRADARESYGLVVVDPPAFAKSRREIAGAARGYIELNSRALRLAAPGGWVVSASCSYNVTAEGFVEYLRSAAAHAERDVFLTELAGAAPDHPFLLTLPESRYLKCAFLRVADAR